MIDSYSRTLALKTLSNSCRDMEETLYVGSFFTKSEIQFVKRVDGWPVQVPLVEQVVVAMLPVLVRLACCPRPYHKKASFEVRVPFHVAAATIAATSEIVPGAPAELQFKALPTRE